VTTCTHPADRLSPGVLDPDATYCGACSSLMFPDGRVEPVRITGFQTTPRRASKNGRDGAQR
jgi:hypothetical protein